MNPEESSQQGDVNYFKTVALEVLGNYRRNNDNATCLQIAASDGQLECCEVIYERCPALLFIEDASGNTIFHLASTYAVLEFFVEIAGSIIEEDGDMETKVQYKNLLKKLNNQKTAAFWVTIFTHHLKLDGAKLWLKANRDYNLDLLSSNFKGHESLMHMAVVKGDLDLVKLLIDEEPDFVYGPTSDGDSYLLIPLFYAVIYSLVIDFPVEIANASPFHVARVKIRKMLLEYQPNQTMVLNEEGYSALHQAAAAGDADAVSDIIDVFPKCMELVDANAGRNFLHIAANLHAPTHIDVVIHALGRNDVPDSVLNQVDNDGNTPLHIAAQRGTQDLVFPLLYDSRVDKMIRNAKGELATDLITYEFDKNKAFGVEDSSN